MRAAASRKSPQTVLITGATGGIGGALALEYAAPRRTLFLHGRDEERLGAIARECEARGARTHALVFDLRDIAELTARVDEIAAATPIDLAIVNAGVSSAAARDGESWKDIERVIDVNIRASFATVAALLPHMRRRGSGQIALVSSLAGYHGLALTPSYCASKAALKSYGEALRAGLARDGIAVSVVMPGFVKTAMSDAFPGPRPFLVSAQDAARRIRSGLARNAARISFPQPLAFGAWLLSALPASWSHALLRRLRL